MSYLTDLMSRLSETHDENGTVHEWISAGWLSALKNSAALQQFSVSVSDDELPRFRGDFNIWEASLSKPVSPYCLSDMMIETMMTDFQAMLSQELVSIVFSNDWKIEYTLESDQDNNRLKITLRYGMLIS